MLAIAATLSAATFWLEGAEPVTLASRIADGERILGGLPRSAFTVQLLLACEGFNAEEALGAEDSDAPRFLVPTTYRGATCYRVFSGVYPSRREALTAAGRAPARFDGPVPVRIASLARGSRLTMPEAAPLPEERTPVQEDAEVPPPPEPVYLLPRAKPPAQRPAPTPPPS